MMTCLAFSVGSCSPTKLNTPGKCLSRYFNKTQVAAIKFSNQHQSTCPPQKQHQLNESTAPFTRREAIGFGLGFGLCSGLVDPLLQTHPCAAAEGGGGAPCELIVAPSGLAFCDKVVGVGSEAAKGQLIKAHYVGKLENGQVFDSSYSRGKPLTFRIGVGEVIKGWDQGILGGDGIPPMLAGGKRILKIPPELAYGVRGAGCRGGSCIIPPDSVLMFDVEFVGKA